MKHCSLALAIGFLASVALPLRADPAQSAAAALALSDPSRVSPPPPGSVGFADRSPKLDVLPGFRNPPPGYGIVPFYWWLGDPLTKERLAWQLQQMEGMGVSGYQINYAHSERGGHRHGFTYASEPAIFSKDWWDLVGWFMQEAKKQGAGVSLSDYTLGFGQGYIVDELLRDHPEVRGMELRMGSDGKVTPHTVDWSLSPIHPMSGKWYAERFFGQFEKRFPGEGGKGLNFFFSDELQFGVMGRLWSKEFPDEFQKRKGYDIVPELAALFRDTGPRTPKVRMDYYDVVAALSEEGFFKPCFDWHQERGMIMGCDHGGRGRQVNEFADYFRTQRWNQGPGADQPMLRKDVVKAKVAASIAHLYNRPRVWLEGFYSSGWGTSSAGLIDATFANYAMGFNLLGLHGMYYSTHGGWWEWAPPDNTFRMPYWRHLKGFMECQQRLAYLLSQGDHRCDVALIYPVAPAHAALNGSRAGDTAFANAGALHANSVDFDFMDFQSLDRARIVGRELHVSGNVYKALVLPGMRAIHHSTLKKALEFKRAGGLVLATGVLPTESDRVGRDDPEVAAMVGELFPSGVVSNLVAAIPFRDYVGPGIVSHRRIGPRDVYAIYGGKQDAECFFRATGAVELWDPWTGETKPLPVLSQNAEGTKLRLPLSGTEMQIIVFSPGRATITNAKPATEPAARLALDGEWEFEIQPMLDNRFGDFHWPPTDALVGAEARCLKYADETAPNPGREQPGFDDAAWREVTCGYGPRFWKLGPLPATADADETLASLQRVDPSVPVTLGGKEYRWEPFDFSWRFGLPGDCGRQGYHGLKIRVMDENIGLGGIEHGHPDCRRVPEKEGTRYYLWSSVHAPAAGATPVSAGGHLPARAWLAGRPFDPKTATAELAAGSNPLLLRYDQPGRGWLVFGTATRPPTPASDQPLPWNTDLATTWFKEPGRLAFDTRPDAARPAGWYRFTAPPGLRAVQVPCAAKPRAWVNGVEAAVSGAAGAWTITPATPAVAAAVVAIRLDQPRGEYGGATFSDYLRLDCGAGRITPGDWSKQGVLATYSGGAWYRKTIEVSAGQAAMPAVLDLGEVVASAEVRVNGQLRAIKTAPPWKVDVSGHLKPGTNRIEVLVCNTLANHYVTIPTHFRGSTASGLMGPVRLEFRKP